MNVIAAVKRWSNYFRVRRVQQHLFKVNDFIEGVVGSNPLIQNLPLCFLLRAEDAGDHRGAAEGSLRRANHLHAAVMPPLNELLHARDQIIDADGFTRGRKLRTWQPDVDNAFKNDDVFDARPIKRVVIKASQPVYAEFGSSLRGIMKNPVAYNSRVQHPKREAVLRQPFGQNIGPA